ncbi:MAG: HD domain-containing protein [Candidatus Woesearchaeota archaeon]|nr:HD domain-containing protein [Candidatus Woesearchaeota archaeon]
MIKMEMHLEKAEEFAIEKHQGQYRKYPSDVPYITHPGGVVKILKMMGVNDDITLSVAWLHDVAEDCNVSLDEIAREFNEEIADLVKILTKCDNKEEYVKRFLNTDRRAQLIKLADVAHNSGNIGSALSNEKAERFKYFCEKYYLPLAERICPRLYSEIKNNLN